MSGHMMTVRCWTCWSAAEDSHLPLLHHHGLAPRRRVLIDAGEEVLGDPEGVLQERVVRVAAGRVLQ